MKLLKQKIQIKEVEIHNRLVMPPMATSQADHGEVTPSLLNYYSEKTAGGYIGLVITEHSYIRQDGISDPGQVSVSRDADVEGLKKLADAIHANGAKAIVQINHAGFTADSYTTGLLPVCVSKKGYTNMTGRNTVSLHEISETEIPELVRAYAEAARRVREAGFDGVELHSAHGFLLNQFYSPLSNCRSDNYGGCLENRIRIHLEIIEAVRGTVDDSFILAMRLGASDYSQGGTTLEESIKAAALLESAGLDLLDISGGFCGFTRPGHKEQGYFGELTEAIKKQVSIPIILTGGVSTGADAETLLKAKKADFIGVGRAILRDSQWAAQNMR